MNILKSNGNVDSMQYQTGKVSTEMQTTRKNQMEMLEMKKTVTETNDIFNRINSRFGIAEKIIT